MLMPHERESLEESRSQAADTRMPTAISGYIGCITAYSYFKTDDDVIMKVILFLTFVCTVVFLLMNGITFFEAQFKIAMLTRRAKKNERRFYKEMYVYQDHLVQTKR